MRRSTVRRNTVKAKNTPLILAAACALLGAAPYLAVCQQSGGLPECEWCGADEAPKNLSWSIVIADSTEPGEHLTITGTVFAPDGITPAGGVLLYTYHTNAAGVYPRRGDETGNGRRHGYLRGWLRTDNAGRYRIITIRPGSYPGRREPEHIHMTVRPPGGQEYWIDSVNFEEDPLLTATHRRRLGGRGGSGIVRLQREPAGGWKGTRNIVLEAHP